MPDRKSEYDPEEVPVIEPDEDPEYEPEDEPTAPTSMGRAGAQADGSGEHEFEYRTEVLSVAQLADGKTLAGLLASASTEGWHYVGVLDAGERRVVLLRKLKKTQRERRSVGFAAPGRS
ncbi:MAG TPA: hypothetical protein VNG93_13395 [Candidatus Dormibacteraeota bacterium]|nr:hypothetical protein [Candidatus Dormibacteraeota bacterium]